MSEIPRNSDGSFTLYNVDGISVTLTFPASPGAGFKVVTKDVPAGLPSNYTWLLNFGVQNSAGHFLPSVSYNLHGTDRPDKKGWVVYYAGSAHAMNGDHTSPGDPPIGYG
jgi:hypothetical protein